ncbi:MAG TPA: phage major capsid protein, partial [Xanthobacteraceae bacterium]
TARIASAWKVHIGTAPPPADDVTLRREMIGIIKQFAPDPDEGESHDDYIERCTDELSDDMDDDDAEEACQLAWDENGDGDDGDRAGPVFHKTHAQAADGMEFILSDATPDRFGDIVEVDGWETEQFARNPIALFNHDKGFPIGKWQNIKINKGADLRAELQLAPKGTSPRIDEIRKLIEADILRAVSVGFVPRESAEIKGTWGTRFMKHELVEASLVAVPANPNALAVAKSLNISPATVRMVFGEHAGNDIKRRDFDASRGEHANKQRSAETASKPGEHATPSREREKGKPMLLSQRIQESERNLLSLQDNLDKHLETIDDNAPTDEQMIKTEDLSGKIEAATRHLKNLRAIEASNGHGAADAGELARKSAASGNGKLPVEFAQAKKKIDPIDYIVRAAIVQAKSRIDNVTIDDMRRKIYGDHEVTRVMTDLMLKAASAPANTTVTGWAAELVRTIWSAWMEALLAASVYPRLAASGLSLDFGANGKIVIPTRSLTPALSGSFVGEGAPIPVRQGAFTSQTLTPKKMAVITTWTREMSEHSIPAIEGLLRQALIEDTAIALDAVLLGNGAATTIAPAGLRSYQAATTGASGGAGQGYANFVTDYKALFNALITLTNGNVRTPVMIINPAQGLSLSMLQPPAAAAPLYPFMTMVDGGRILRAGLLESSTVPAGQVILVDAADFVSVGGDGPRLEISDQATLHMEDTAPADIVTGPVGTPVPATPVKSMWQTDSLALRMIMPMNFIMRRPVVAWIASVAWGV